MPFQPIHRMLVVGLVPQPRQLPAPPFPRDALQRLFFDVSRDFSYQQFVFLPGEVGANFVTGPDDQVSVQPALIQIQTPIDLTKERAREKVTTIVKTAFSRLDIGAFIQCGIKVVAHVEAPGTHPDAKSFVSERLMVGSDRIDDLGAGFFGGGVKFRRVTADQGREDNLLVEPWIHDNGIIFVDYDVARHAVREPLTNLESLSEWLDEAFSFVEHQAMGLLEA